MKSNMASSSSLLLLLSMVGIATAAVVPSSTSPNAPVGLLCDLKRSPSLGVRAQPSFGWIVPPCTDGPDHQQTAYQVVVSDEGANVWDSGKVMSNESTNAAYGGPALMPGHSYEWQVTTYTTPSGGGTPCASAQSESASFVTALFNGFDNSSVSYITVAANAKTSITFGYFRKEITVPAGVTSVQAFVSSTNADPLLNGYKMFVDGVMINNGPGRGEAPVWAGDGQFRSSPYYTLDVTDSFKPATTVVVAFEAMHQGSPSVLLQLHFNVPNTPAMVVGTDASWMSFNGDVHRKPGKAQHGNSAGTGFLEYIDARMEPVGWKTAGFNAGSGWTASIATPWTAKMAMELHAKMQPPMQYMDVAVRSIGPAPAPPGPPGPPSTCVDTKENAMADIGCPAGQTIKSVDFASFGTPTGSCSRGFTINPKCNSNHSMQVVSQACVGKQACTVDASCKTFDEPLKQFCWDTLKYLGVKVTCGAAAANAVDMVADKPPTDATSTAFLADFGRELQGGVRLTVGDGVAGQNVTIACGEAMSGSTVTSTWGWEFTWTLRDGPQVLEQHKFMECRFVSLVFDGKAPTNFTLSGWKTHYPYYEGDSMFTSSNATLNAVFELCRYTLEAASLDTYTDSNTRERRPYEADGIIAASARLMIQRDFMWPRHSHAWVINDPTWPVEWQQISAFLGWQDYMATGQPDLALAFMDQMHDRTKYSYLDSTGLLDTSKMGRHIVDWMPDGHEGDETVKRGEFTASDHTSVSNGFAVRGLQMLAEMVGVGGRSANATQFSAEAAGLKKAMVAQMWNGTAYCDGPCKDVKGASLMMTNMFTLAFGLVPEANVASVWSTVADWGMEQIGDYGAFWYQLALGGGYYAAPYETPDDGSAIYHALTKCDEDSWCSGLLEDNLTMTRESWHDGTYSHEWGTSAISGVVWGLMGIHQTAPGFATFTIKPKLGGLDHASITLPTLRGFISVNATQGAVSVDVPCNSKALVCLPRSAQDKGKMFTKESTMLLLDGVEVESTFTGGHLCASAPIGCGVDGKSRSFSALAR